MKKWYALLFIGLASFWIWHFCSPRKPVAALPELKLLPGSEVDAWLARGALVVEGDIADPVERVQLWRKGGGEVPFEGAAVWAGKMIVFAPLSPGGEYEAKIKTKFRNVVRNLTAPESTRPVEILRVALHAPTGVSFEDCPFVAVAFSSDSSKLAVVSATGEFKVVELPGGNILSEQQVQAGKYGIRFDGGTARLEPSGPRNAEDPVDKVPLSGSYSGKFLSGDGRWLGAIAARANEMRLFEIPSTAKEPRLIYKYASTLPVSDSGAISPDGRYIAFGVGVDSRKPIAGQQEYFLVIIH